MKHVVKASKHCWPSKIYMALKCLLDKRNHLTFFENQGICFYLERTHDKPDLQMDVDRGQNFVRKRRVQFHTIKFGKQLFEFCQKFMKNVSLLPWVKIWCFVHILPVPEISTTNTNDIQVMKVAWNQSSVMFRGIWNLQSWILKVIRFPRSQIESSEVIFEPIFCHFRR